jgi:hypothetical protein
MEFNRELVVAAPRAQVWAALNDVDRLRRCVPGCEALEALDDSRYQAVIKASIGPVSARFKTEFAISDRQPPESYVLSGRGSGGPAGFGEGSARIRLIDEGTATRVRYDAQLKVTGKLAQIGSRLLENALHKISNQFCDAFQAHFAGSSGTPASSEP